MREELRKWNKRERICGGRKGLNGVKRVEERGCVVGGRGGRREGKGGTGRRESGRTNCGGREMIKQGKSGMNRRESTREELLRMGEGKGE